MNVGLSGNGDVSTERPQKLPEQGDCRRRLGWFVSYEVGRIAWQQATQKYK
jgi:hypothetical protein